MIDVKVDTEHTEEAGAASDGKDDDVTEGYKPAKNFESVKKPVKPPPPPFVANSR